MQRKCGEGQIERAGYSYTKKKTQKKVSVQPTCIQDKGKPGKGLKLIPIPKYDVGLLSKHGYSLADNHEKRVAALKKAIKANGELKVLRHLNAIRTLSKSNYSLYNKLDKDMKWIQKDYAKKKGGDKDWDEDFMDGDFMDEDFMDGDFMDKIYDFEMDDMFEINKKEHKKEHVKESNKSTKKQHKQKAGENKKSSKKASKKSSKKASKKASKKVSKKASKKSSKRS